MGSVTLGKRGIKFRGVESIFGTPEFDANVPLDLMDNHKHLRFARNTLVFDSKNLIVKSSLGFSTVTRPITGLIQIVMKDPPPIAGQSRQQVQLEDVILVTARELFPTIGTPDGDACAGAVCTDSFGFFSERPIGVKKIDVATIQESSGAAVARNCEDICVIIITFAT